MKAAVMTAAEGFLTRLGQHGIKYLFANSGTDFAPLIEAYENADDYALALWPKPLTITHETVAVGMAHGAFLVSNQPQAVMVHVNVGLANAIMGLINAQSDKVPILMFAGRTPITEFHRLGSRMTPIQYGQEMFDQAGMLRDVVKWDYEIRYAEQIIDAVDRAVSVATSAPTGPVFLGLPREPLAEPMVQGRGVDHPLPPRSCLQLPDNAALELLAEKIAKAKFPLLICQRGDASGQLGEAVNRLCKIYPIGVIEPFVITNSLAADHPCHLGYQTKGLLEKSDCLIVVESPVPWIQRFATPANDCHIAHIGHDPLFTNMPMRSFPSSQNINGAAHLALDGLAKLLAKQAGEPVSGAIVKAFKKTRDEGLLAMLDGLPQTGVITADMVAVALADYLDQNTIVFSELGPAPDLARPGFANQWFTPPYSGGLGWGIPAALGAKLAAPEKRVIACVGDGSYIFANPVACNQVMAALSLPVLVIILNNQSWNATRRAAHNMYPDGAVSKINNPVLTDLAPSPDFTAIASANGGWTSAVNHSENMATQIAKAMEIVDVEKRPATIDLRVAKRDGF